MQFTDERVRIKGCKNLTLKRKVENGTSTQVKPTPVHQMASPLTPVCHHLTLKRRVENKTSTPIKQTPAYQMKSPGCSPVKPAHHQMASPGQSAEPNPFLTPREAYELGLRSEPAWNGERILQCSTSC